MNLSVACVPFVISFCFFSIVVCNHNLDLDLITNRRWLETQPICCVQAGFAQSESDLRRCITAAKQDDPVLKRIAELECPKYILQGENHELEAVIRNSECSSLATDRGALCSKRYEDGESGPAAKYSDCDALEQSTRPEVQDTLSTEDERCLCNEGFIGHIPKSVAGRTGVGCQWRTSDLERKLERLQTCKCRSISYTTMSHCHLEDSCLDAETDYDKASDEIIRRNGNQPPSDACFSAMDAAICAYHFSLCTSDSKGDRFPTVCKTTCDNLYKECNITLNEVTLIEKCPGQLTNGEWDEDLGRDADDEDCTASAPNMVSPFGGWTSRRIQSVLFEETHRSILSRYVAIVADFIFTVVLSPNAILPLLTSFLLFVVWVDSYQHNSITNK